MENLQEGFSPDATEETWMILVWYFKIVLSAVVDQFFFKIQYFRSPSRLVLISNVLEINCPLKSSH